jgi:hypothetical protein
MNDFIRSEYCYECDGLGYLVVKRNDHSEEFEQCYECEELLQQELRADILHDILKGN